MGAREFFKVRPAGMIEMSGSDTRMDQQGNRDEPVNPLPVRCATCQFPDIDHVPKPYRLLRGRCGSPNELALAEMGCFLVRQRARDVLEKVVPGQVRFFPTVFLKTERETTPWSLAVPAHFVDPFHPNAKMARCPACGEARTAHYGTQCVLPKSIDSSRDVARSRQWMSGETIAEERQLVFQRIVYEMSKDPKDRPPRLPPKSVRDNPSPEHPWTREQVDRQLYFSRRLTLLLGKLKLRGVNESFGYDMSPTPEEADWIEQQAARVAGRGGRASKSGSPKKSKSAAPNAKKWFAGYLRQNMGAKSPADIDFPSVEDRRGIKLPVDYKRFMTIVGARTFKDVMEQEGFTAKILPPAKFDWREYRAKERSDASGDERVDGVMFAVTGHGDCFVFDVSRGKGGDYPVYHFDHETDEMIPFARNFVECIWRFAGGGGA